MADPNLDITVRLNVLRAWQLYVDTKPFADDVQRVLSAGTGGLRLYNAMTKGARGQSGTLGILGAMALSARSQENMSLVVLRAMGIIDYRNVSDADVITFWTELNSTFVPVSRQDGTIYNRGLSDWEKFSFTMQMFGGFDPQNIAKFTNDTIKALGTLSEQQKEMFRALGVNVDLYLSADEATLQALTQSLNRPLELPPDLQLRLDQRIWTTRPKCFVAGTSILTPHGSKPIEQIQVGDLVMAFDPAEFHGRGALRPAAVVRTFTTLRQHIWRLGDRQIGITPGHTCVDGDDGQERPLGQIVARGGSLIDSEGRRHRVKVRTVASRGDGTLGVVDSSPQMIPFPSGWTSNRDIGRSIQDGLALAMPAKTDELSVVWVEDQREVETVYNFEVEGLHTYVAGGWRVHNDSLDARQLGSSLGSFIGSTLLDIWGVDNIAVRLGVGAVASSLGAWIGDTLHHGLGGEAISSPLGFFNNFGGSLITSAVNLGGAAVGRALLGAISLQNDPLANGLASIFGGALAQRGAIEIVRTIAPETGLQFLADWGLFGVRQAYALEPVIVNGDLVGYQQVANGVDIGSIGGSLANAAAGFIGSFAGGKLAAAIFNGDQQSIALGASIGGTIGSIIGSLAGVQAFFSAALGPALAGAGLAGPIGIFALAFIGAFMGGALGSALGPAPSWGEADFGLSDGVIGTTGSRGSGRALQIATQLGGAAIGLESSILGAIGGRLVSIDTLTIGMTESNKTIYARVGGFQYTGTSGEMALEQGALAQLRTARIAGGDLLSKQTLHNSDADTRQELSDDLALANAYALYSDNKALFEAKLDEVMASRGGAGAWAAQKARAEGQLDLDGAFTAATYRAHSETPVWNIGATTQLASIAAPAEAPPTPPAMGSAVMAYSAPLIAFDLNRDGVIAQGVAESGALFDIDGDGFREQTGWLTPWDAFLVFDRNHDGEINSIVEMAVSQAYVGASGNSLGIVLSGLDSDADGTFDADDAEFFEARLWTDRNLNGYVDLGELWSLTRFGIDHISLTGVAVSDGENDYRDSGGNKIGWESAFGINGAQADAYGLFTTLSLAFNTMGVKSTQDPDRPDWFLLEHEGGESTAFGLGSDGLGLVGNATFARTLFGSEGNDTLTASDIAGAVAGVPGIFIDGKAGDDVIAGGAADDVLSGGKGRDHISGGGGDDVITADDSDILAEVTGGEGLDSLIYDGDVALDLDISTLGFEIAIGGRGDDHLRSSVEGVALGGGAGNDVIEGTAVTDRLEGDEGDDSLTGGAGDDQLSGGAGVDEIDAGAGDDLLFVDAADFADGVQRVSGGVGHDTLVVEGSAGARIDLSAANVEIAIGGAGDDRLRAGAGTDAKVLYGEAGDDVLVSGAGADEIVGGDGLDSVSYEDSNAAVNVNLGTGVWTGGHAAGDVLASVEGVIGSAFADTLTGNTGDNILEGGAGADAIDGGDGKDAASYRSSSAAVQVDLSGAAPVVAGGDAAGDTLTDIENLIGSAHNDELTGSDLANVLEGLAGADALDGRGGSDTASYRSSDAGVSVNLRTGATLGGHAGGDTLLGIENVTGSRFDDILTASAAANAFDGGAGTDRVSYAGATAGVEVNLTLSRGFGGDAEGDTFANIENAEGGAGDDILKGDGGANVLSGGDGADTLRGGGGGDRLQGGLGNDTYSFGSGDGVVVVDDLGGLDAITFRDGLALDDLVIEARGGDVFIALRDPSRPYAGVGELGDRLEIRSGTGQQKRVERLIFDDGEIFLQAIGPDQQRLVGSSGTDLLVGDERGNTLEGGAGDDWLFGGGGNDWLFGDAGNDTLYGGDGRDWLFGGDGDDLVFGDAGDDLLFGGDGDDTLIGGPGDDRLEGEAGNDVLDGGPGNDVLVGGTGFDVYLQRRGGGHDRIYDADGMGRLDFVVDTTFYGINNTDSLAPVFNNWTNFIGLTPSPDPISGIPWNVGTGRYYSGQDYTFGILPTELQRHDSAAAPFVVIWSSTATVRSLYTPGSYVQWFSPQQYQATMSTNFMTDWAPGRNNPSLPTSPSFPQGWVNYNVESLFTPFYVDNLVDVRFLAGNDMITGTEFGDVLRGLGGDDKIYGYGGNDLIQGGDDHDALSGGDGNDLLQGGAGNDSLDGGKDNDELQGGAGTDTLSGGSGDDVLRGEDGMDRLDGGSGNDQLFGGKAADQLAGGEGDDTLKGEAGYDKLYGDGGNDLLLGGDGDDELSGWTGDDRLEGEVGDDLLYGGDGADTLLGGADRDSLYGNAGDDTLDGGDGSDALYGGDGADTLLGSDGDDHLSGGTGDDVIRGEAGADKLWGGAGQDRLEGGAGDDQIDGEAGDDRLYGGLGADTMVGNEGADRLFGEAGNDALYGGSGDDSLLGGEGDDTLSGWSGLDFLWGGAGDDALTGGEGNDQLFGGLGADALLGGLGNDELVGGDGSDGLLGGVGNDRLFGGAGVDILEGGDGDDFILGGADIDFLYGGADNDFLWGGTSEDVLSGGEGDDRLSGDAGDDQLTGDAGADMLLGGAGHDRLAGGEGNDLLLGGDGADRIAGDAGDDTLSGEAGNDELAGGAGADTLYGDTGDDTLFGGDGADQLVGGDGVDILRGEAGNDFLWGGAGNDALSGNDGDDAIDGGAGSDTADGGAGADLLLGGGGDDALAGEAGDDRLAGGEGQDALFGGDGTDALDGGAEADVLRGEAGDDRLEGGAGDDDLAGGAGSDAFVFRAGFGSDRIADFAVGEDWIDLVGLTLEQTVVTDETGGARVAIGADSVFVAGVTAAALLPRLRSVAEAPATVDTSAMSAAPELTLLAVEVAMPQEPIGLSWSKVVENADGAEIGVLTLDPVVDGVSRTVEVSDARFEVVDGQLRLKTGHSLDREAEPFVMLTVTVTVTVTETGTALARSQQFRIDTTNVNEGPTALALSSATVLENAKGAVIGALAVSDPDAGDSHGFVVSDNRFEVVGGSLRLKADKSLDFEGAPSVTVTVTATDQGGLSHAQDFVIAVGDLNEKPLSTALSSSAMAAAAIGENGAVVGILSAVDPDTGDAIALSVSDARFEVVGGQLKLKADQNLAAVLTALGSQWLSVEVTATDAGGLSREETFFLSGTGVSRQVSLDAEGRRVRETLDNGNGTEARLTLDTAGSEPWAFRNEQWQKATTTSNTAPFNTYYWQWETHYQNVIFWVNDGYDESGNPIGHWDTQFNVPYQVNVQYTVSHTRTITEKFDSHLLSTTIVGDDGTAGATVTEAPPPTNQPFAGGDQPWWRTTETREDGVLVHTAIDYDPLVRTVAENSAGMVVGALSIAGPTAGATRTYTLSDNRFEVVGNELRLKTGQSLDFESAAQFGVTVTATDSNAVVHKQIVTINVTDAAEAPNSIALSNATILRNADGVAVGAVTAIDQDAGSVLTYAVSDSRFEIVDGQLKLKVGQSLGAAERSWIELNVTATDQGGLGHTEGFSVLLQDGSGNTSAHSEVVNAQGKIVSQTIQRGDGTEQRLTFDVADAAAWSLRSEQWEKSYATPTVYSTLTTSYWQWETHYQNVIFWVNDAFDELGNPMVDASGNPIGHWDTHFNVPYQVNVQYTSTHNLQVTTTYDSHRLSMSTMGDDGTTVVVDDPTVDETSPFVGGDQPWWKKIVTYDNGQLAKTELFYDPVSTPAAAENRKGLIVATLAFVDPAAGAVRSYSVSDSRFEVVNNQLKLKADQAFDFEAVSGMLTVVVTATDSNGMISKQEVKFSVADVNDAPTDVALSVATVVENDAGAEVGQLSAVDPDAGGQIKFTVSDSRFEVVDNRLKLKALESLDHEAAPSIIIDVTATDQNGLELTESFTIVATNVNESPIDVSLSSATVVENATGVVIGALGVVDPDANNTHSFTVSDSRFEVVNGQLRLKAGYSLDFEAAPTVNVGVTATDQGGLSLTEQFAIAVSNVNEVPVDIALASGTLAENAVGVAIGAVAVADPDAGDTHTLVVSDDRFEIVNGVLKLKAEQSLNFETTPTVSLTITATDAVGLSFSRAFAIAVVNVNENPAGLVLSAAWVRVNEPGAVVGTLTITDPDADDGHGFTVSDNRFEVVNGQLKLKAGQSLSAPADQVLNVTVTATDQGGLSLSRDFAIDVETNEKPMSIGLSSSVLAPGTIGQNGAVVGTLSAVDPDAGDTATFGVSDARFEVANGQLKLKADQNLAALLTALGAQWLAVEVTATDSGSLSREETFFLSASGVSRQAVLDGDGRRARETLDNGNGTEARLTLDASESEPWAFRNEQWQKATTTSNTAPFNTYYWQWETHYQNVIFWVNDGYDESGNPIGHWDTQFNVPYQVNVQYTVSHTRTITEKFDSHLLSTTIVGDDGTAGATVTEAPPPTNQPFAGGDQPWWRIVETREDGVLVSTVIDYDPLARAIAENGAGLVVGALSIAGPASGATRAYTLSDNRFEVVGNELRLKTGQSLDFEATATLQILVTASDSNAVVSKQNVTVNVTDVNDAPADITVASSSVAENAAGVAIGALGVVDPDAGNEHTLSVSDSRFEIVGGQLRLKAGSSLNFEAGSSVSLAVTATDQSGLSYSKVFTIAVTNVNEAPHGITLGSTSVREAISGAAVGSVTAVDPDAAGSHTFSVSDSRFEVVGGQLRLKVGHVLDFESGASISLTVTATDQGGLSYAQQFTLTVTDENEAPTGISLQSTSVDESSAGAIVGTVSALDLDAGNTHVLTASDSRFEIVNGQLKLKAGQSLNFEVTPVINLTITATDAGGLSITRPFAITVEDLNDAPTSLSVSSTRIESNMAGAVVGAVSVADIDAVDSHQFAVSDDRFEIANGQLKLKPGQSIDPAASPLVVLTVTATDSGGLSTAAQFVLRASDGNGLAAANGVGTGVGALDGMIRKTGATGWGTGGASSSRSFTGTGYVEAVVTETTTSRYVGLSDIDSDSSYASVDFAFGLSSDGTIYLYQSGATLAHLGAYATGDVVRVERLSSGHIAFKKNGTTLYTTSSVSTAVLSADVALYETGSSLSSVRLSVGGTAAEPVTWANEHGVSIGRLTQGVVTAVADVNGDGRSDVVLAAADGRIWVRHGQADETLGSAEGAGVGVSGLDGLLRKVSGTTAWGDGGASSSQAFTGAGYVEAIVTETTTSRMFGLSDVDTDPHHFSIDYGFGLSGNGSIYIYEGSTLVAQPGAYATGDVMRVERLANGQVAFKRNGSTIYTSQGTSTAEFRVDTAFYEVGSTLRGIGLSVGGSPAAHVTWVNEQNVASGRLAASGTTVVLGDVNGDGRADAVLAAADGRLWIRQGLADGTLGQAVGVGDGINGNVLRKTGGTASWGDAGASSSQSFTGVGYAEFTVSETTLSRMFGLSDADTDVNYASIDYGIVLSGDGGLYMHENGVYKAHLGTYATGDVIRIERLASGQVVYKQNGVVEHTSLMTSTAELRVDVSLCAVGSTVQDVVLSAGGGAVTPVTWVNEQNVTQNRLASGGTSVLLGDVNGDGRADAILTAADGRLWVRQGQADGTFGRITGAGVGVSGLEGFLRKTAGSVAWDSGASSSQRFTGAGYVETVLAETTTYRMLALTADADVNGDYTPLDFAIHVVADSTLVVYENGVLRAYIGTYTTGDRLRIERLADGHVVYKKNGTTLHTSATISTAELHVDTAFYSPGATLQGVTISGGGGAIQAVSWVNEVGVVQNRLATSATTTLADVNGDGRADAVLAAADGRLWVRQGQADGTFSRAVGMGVGVGSLDRVLRKVSGPDQWGAAGASSSQTLTGAGYVEATAVSTGTALFFGLSDIDSDQNYPSIDYAVHYTTDSNAYLYESGVYKTHLGYTAGDKFRIERLENGQVVFKKNGSVVYTSATVSTNELRADTSFLHLGATLQDVVMAVAGGTAQPVTWVNEQGLSQGRLAQAVATSLADVNGDGRADAVLSAADGRLWIRQGQADGTFGLATAAGNGVPGLNNLRKTTGDAWSDSGASSSQTLAGAGYVEVTATETSTWRMFSLSSSDLDYSYTSMNFGISMGGDGNLRLWQSNTLLGIYGTYATGDKIRIERMENGQIAFKKNGTTLYTSSNVSTGELRVDTALYTGGATLQDVVISAGGGAAQAVQWINEQNVAIGRLAQSVTTTLADVNGDGRADAVLSTADGRLWVRKGQSDGTFGEAVGYGSGVSGLDGFLRKTAGSVAWDSGASSSQRFTGAGYVETVLAETTTYRMLALTADADVNGDYTPLDFAIHVVADSTLVVYENGVLRAYIGTYTTGDRLRIERLADGHVVYKKNGSVLYTSAAISTAELHVDTSFHSPGSTLQDVVISMGGAAAQAVRWVNEVGVATNRLAQTVTTTLADVDGDGWMDAVLTAADGRVWVRSAANFPTDGSGDDLYVVDEPSDTVTEAAGQGTDTVVASITHTLAVNVENLTILTGAGIVNGTGNGLANIIVGNDAANALQGAAGADTLLGGAGNDTLTGGTGDDVLDGGAGNDRFVFDRGDGNDIVHASITDGTDTIAFGTMISYDQLWFARIGDDLVASVIGENQSVTVNDWFSGTSHRAGKVETLGGTWISDTGVDQLVQAMASFSPPPAGQTTLPSGLASSLAPSLAANWQQV